MAVNNRAILNVCSSDRNTTIYPNDNSFRVALSAPLYSIVRAKLVSAEIPNTEYSVSTSNNKLYFYDSNVGGGTVVLIATVTPGSYTGATMAAALDTAIEGAVRADTGLSAGLSGLYAVTFDVDTMKLTITRSGGPTFTPITTSMIAGSPLAVVSLPTLGTVGGPNNILSAIGFESNEEDAAAATTGDAVVKLGGENFCYLCIPGLAAMTTTDGIPNIFAKLILDVPPGFICFDKFISNPIEFAHPMPILKELDVKFVKRNGSLYDFQGCAPSFAIEFEVNRKCP